jgi:exonuclease SbcD
MSRHLKIVHTSDWHLGHTLHGHCRAHEHRAFLRFLLETLVGQEADALVVAGDVFDTANPPAAAQAMFYRFLADARAALPKLDVLVVSGNHDSAARLGAAAPVLAAVGVRVIGAVPRLGRGGRAPVDAEAMVVPLHDRGGEIAAWVAAVPYLRPQDLPVVDRGSDDKGDPLVEGVRGVYDAVLGAARAKLRPGQALLATGHCHMVDATQTEASERKILGGAKHALPVSIFGDDVAYVALGHLHLAQAVGAYEHVRYSGSPIPLSMPEQSYRHELRVVRFEGGALAGQLSVRIPRAVEVLRVPDDGPGELDLVLTHLGRLEVPERAALPNEGSAEARPFLEVRVRLTEPVPDLRRRVEEAIGERAVRLVKITIEHEGKAQALAERAPRRELSDLTEEEVFLAAYAQRFEGAPSPALLAAFHEVAAAARRQLEGGEA